MDLTESKKVNYNEIDIVDSLVYKLFRNVYKLRNNLKGKWAQKDSSYLIKYSGENLLEINVWFQDFEKYSYLPITLEIIINDLNIITYNINHRVK